ncbi:MAG: recombinase family protein [Pseudomonadota bacterium]
MKTVHCAIYTRKSSEEGLEQDFNSLDAQREACAAYVLSQASEGWKLLPECYDDGGLSGGTLERPALQRLLDDVRTGRIDIIVVYKVDRLTRSLLDFAKLVEAFNAADVSFVSVTQSFNTTTSMGRLTLNMLLSFAQFEREVTAERIRDKIAASKAKGMWMGGVPPLGYEPDGRTLKIVEEHAQIVRRVFERYAELGNVRLVKEELIQKDERSPIRTTWTGKTYGGGHLSRGQIYTILKNPIYIGRIAHKGETFAGQHEAIIDLEQWQRVQAKLRSNSPGKRLATRRNTSPLAGLLFTSDGERLVPVHSTKGKKRYRYYISQSHKGGGNCDHKATRIPALELERLMRGEIKAALAKPTWLIEKLGPEAFAEWARRRCGGEAAKEVNAGDISVLVERISCHPDRLTISLSKEGLAKWFKVAPNEACKETIDIEVDCSLTRSGYALRFVDSSGVAHTQQEASPQMVATLARAHAWWKELAKGEIDIASLSRRESVTASYMTRIVRLAFLSPKVGEAFLDGSARGDLTPRGLFAAEAVVGSWEAQAQRYLPQ